MWLSKAPPTLCKLEMGPFFFFAKTIFFKKLSVVVSRVFVLLGARTRPPGFSLSECQENMHESLISSSEFMKSTETRDDQAARKQSRSAPVEVS